MTQKKDRRSARTKKREADSSSLITGIDSCEPVCDKAVIIDWSNFPRWAGSTYHFKPESKSPAFPFSHSSCAAMSPESCQ